jgi:metal-dependent amidase/aminoacylase/carboxypeptidase family protein
VLQREIPRLASSIAEAHGCRAEVDFDVGYPVTVNDPERTAEAVERLTELFGAARVTEMPDPIMGSEDFSFVLDRVPGAFLFLSASPADIDHATAAANHSPRVLFDDGVLADQAAAFAHLAIRALDSGASLRTES